MLKIVYKNIYAHRSNLSELTKHLNEEQEKILMKSISNNYKRQINGDNYSDYAIIKYNTENDNVSLIECDEWDLVNEPTVGDSYCYRADGSMRVITGGTKVYHSRESFVSNRYKGIDLEAAKRRTETLNSIPRIDSIKNKIGNKDYWHKFLTDNNISI